MARKSEVKFLHSIDVYFPQTKTFAEETHRTFYFSDDTIAVISMRPTKKGLFIHVQLGGNGIIHYNKMI